MPALIVVKKVIKAESVRKKENLEKAVEVEEPALTVDKKVIKVETVLSLENQEKGGGGGGRSCFNCGQDGH